MAGSERPSDMRRIRATVALVLGLVLLAEGGLRLGRDRIHQVFREYFFVVERYYPEDRNTYWDVSYLESIYRDPPAGARRVFFLGDSVCESLGSVTEKSLTGQVQRRLREAGLADARVYNVSKDGTLLVPQLQTMLALARRVRPPAWFVLHFNLVNGRSPDRRGMPLDPEQALRAPGALDELRGLYLLSAGGWPAWDRGAIESRMRLFLRPHVALFDLYGEIRYIWGRLRTRHNLSRALDLRDVSHLSGGRLTPEGELMFNPDTVKFFPDVRQWMMRTPGFSDSFRRENLAVLRYAVRQAEGMGHHVALSIVPLNVGAIAQDEAERETYRRNKSAIVGMIRDGGVRVLDLPEIEGERYYVDQFHMLGEGFGLVARHLAPQIADWIGQGAAAGFVSPGQSDVK